MALGSNSLGLLFKIGVDTGDAVKTVGDLKTAVSTSLVQGFKDGANSASKELQKTGDGLRNLLTPLNEARRGFDEVFSGNVVEGTLNLTRSMGPLGIAIGGVAVAAAGLGFAIKGAIDAASEIGTRSKDDFDELQKKVQSAGESITEVQRAMAQGVVAALDKISGASTAFFAKVLEKDGPALIALFNEIAGFITGTLIPLVGQYGDRISDLIAKTIALAKVLTKDFSLKDYLTGLPTLQDDYNKALAETKKQIADIAKNIPAATFNPAKTKKARKDLTDAALEQAEAENKLSLVRQQAAIADKQINEDQAKGLITQQEGANRRLAVLTEVQKAELAVLDARKKAVLEDPTLLQNQRLKQLDDIETARTKLTVEQGEAQREEANKTIAADQKLHDALTKHFLELRGEWIAYAEFVHKSTDDIVKDLARQAQAVPGAPDLTKPVPGTKSVEDALKGLPDPHALKDLNSILAELHKQIVQNINDAIAIGGAWGGFTQTVKELFSLKNIGDQFALMMKSVLDVFIQTGHTGPAVLRQLVAGVLRAIAEMSAEWGTFFLLMAIGFAALGDWSDAIKFGLAGAGLLALAAGLGFAASKVGPSQASTAAGAGAGFGGAAAQPPGTVTINQGAGSALGIQLGQLNALNNISNTLSTASPGDVVTRGAEQNPVAIGQANNEAARRDGSVSREFLQISGLRTA